METVGELSVNHSPEDVTVDPPSIYGHLGLFPPRG